MVGESEKYKIGDETFIGLVDEKTTCICFFGGDPAPQLDKIYRICKKINEREDRIIRFCLETNGNHNFKILKKFAELSLESGGGIKYDIKFWNERLNEAICGISNEKIFEEFRKLGELHKQRREIPFLRASTLLIPGYVDENEVKEIAKFISSVDREIPYTLLAYYPCFEMYDLPRTSKELALKCLKEAKKYLKNVRIGNVNLLR